MPHHGILLVFLLAGLLLALPTACSPGAPGVVRETVVVTQVIQQIVTATTPARTPTLTLAPPVAQATLVDAAPPPPPKAIDTPKPPAPTRQQPPSPTPPRLLVAGIPGEKDKIDGQIVYPDYGPAARTELTFQVKARDPRKGRQDGAGIKSVDFSISDKTGEVYKRTENNAAYCAFGGGEPNCNVFRFADNGFRWPGTNKPIQNGQHTLTVRVHAASGDEWPDASVTFQIQVR